MEGADIKLRSGPWRTWCSAPVIWTCVLPHPGDPLKVFVHTRKSSVSGRRCIAPRCRVSSGGRHPELTLVVGGRIDGVLDAGGAVVVEEIKSTTRDLKTLEAASDPCHWGQAKVYAYLLACRQGLAAVTVQLTYCHLDTGDTLELVEHLSCDQLVFFKGLVIVEMGHDPRPVAPDRMPPLSARLSFAAYRTGQRHMAVAVLPPHPSRWRPGPYPGAHGYRQDHGGDSPARIENAFPRENRPDVLSDGPVSPANRWPRRHLAPSWIRNFA